MSTASATAAVAGQTITAVFYNNNNNAILNELNGNLDENNIRDGVISSLKLAVGAVDLSTNKVTGNIPVARFNSASGASASTFWRGDGTWAGVAPAIGGAFKNLGVIRPSAATVTVTADELIVQTAAGSGVRITSVNVTASLATSGANGLDSGSEAANTLYYVYVIRKSSDGTVAALLSTSATAPTLPNGYDQYALVSAVGNDNSSNIINFYQVGRRYTFAVGAQMASGSTASAWTAVDLTPSNMSTNPGFVPSALSTECFGTLVGTNTNLAISNINTESTPLTNDGTNYIMADQGGAGTRNSYWEMQVFTADTLYWASDAAGAKLYLAGFYLNKLGG